MNVAERVSHFLLGTLTGMLVALMMGLGPQAPDPLPTQAPVTQDARVVFVEEDGSIAGWGCLQGYPCDDTAHAEP